MISVIDLRMFSLFASLSSTRITLMSFLFPKAPAKGVFPKSCCQIHLFNNLHRISHIFCINRTSNQVHHVHLSCILYIPYLIYINFIYVIHTSSTASTSASSTSRTSSTSASSASHTLSTSLTQSTGAQRLHISDKTPTVPFAEESLHRSY